MQYEAFYRERKLTLKSLQYLDSEILDRSFLRSQSAEEKARFETALKTLHLKPKIFSCNVPKCFAHFDTTEELSDHKCEVHGGSSNQIKEGLEDAPKDAEGKTIFLVFGNFG